MQIVLFYHSLISDWNHGNAHFLRGVVSELLVQGHLVEVYEPRDAWSVENLLREPQGEQALEGFKQAYPGLASNRYDRTTLELDRVLEKADLVLVHEWNEPSLVQKVGEHRARTGHYKLLFHDTHHRSVTDQASMAAYDLRHYDGALVFGAVIRDIYLQKGWLQPVWTWHEAADTRVFQPLPEVENQGDLVWIGNWGDDERSAELHEFLVRPVQELGLKARIYGVRYPTQVQRTLKLAGIEYSGWLPNYAAPQVFAQYKVTVHVPRRPYVKALPGIPTIRIFEALACGIPLVSAPWEDVEGLFSPGEDFLVARNETEMCQKLRLVLSNKPRAQELAARGLETILKRHTCTHRVDELLNIYWELTNGKVTST